MDLSTSSAQHHRTHRRYPVCRPPQFSSPPPPSPASSAFTVDAIVLCHLVAAITQPASMSPAMAAPNSLAIDLQASSPYQNATGPCPHQSLPRAHSAEQKNKKKRER
ncbi:hypothetical protein M0R45_009075 [Rubus argutus]|uniref:Uncharacterized protein n=1 Tax=Rubus argutus TaxID=59490 RepID=A0AAW1Y6E9_RUBAR